MIKTKKGKIKVEGNFTEICADLSIIAHALYFDTFKDMEKEEAKEHIMHAVERGFKTQEELEEQNIKMISNLISELGKVLEKVGEE